MGPCSPLASGGYDGQRGAVGQITRSIDISGAENCDRGRQWESADPGLSAEPVPPSGSGTLAVALRSGGRWRGVWHTVLTAPRFPRSPFSGHATSTRAGSRLELGHGHHDRQLPRFQRQALALGGKRFGGRLRSRRAPTPPTFRTASPPFGLVLGYWVGVRRPFHLSLFLTAPRMVLSQDPSTAHLI